MNAERGLPPGRGGDGRRPGSSGPRRLAPAAPPDGEALGRRPLAAPEGEAPGRRAPAGSGAPGRRPPAAASGARGAALAGPTPTSRGPRRLAPPRPVKVRADEAGRPHAVGNRAVEAVRESWLVEDRWWTDAPLRRRYWEVVTADGRDLVVFRDLQGGRWYAQR
jgi:hypothetical protein